MRFFFYIVFLQFFTLSLVPILAQGFLHTNNQHIVDGNGNEVILRGMGLGGWMLQEGYMLQTSSFANAQYEIRQTIEDLIGEANTDAFYDAWLANHCTKADIDSLASWGFNSVRLPMHYNLYTLPIEEEPVAGENTWLDKGFELTDSLLSWCEANNMYLILDLHAAPGGQGMESGISDYDPTKPSLWESQENRDKTVALWQRLAERYADEPWIGGYDLINEVNWNLPGNALLRELYEEITDSIRAVDNNHIIFIEGNWFANDFTGLTPPWDDNMVYSFHKYWSINDQGSIQWVLDMRQTHNVPLWCGEAGENSNTWFTDAIKLLEENNIGWAWWPMKKVESISGPLSVRKSPEYQTLINYWEGNASNPGATFATDALMALAEDLKIENTKYQKDVIDAMFRQVETDETVPFFKHRIPGLIFATDFDLGPNGAAYSDDVTATYHVSNGTFTAWNNGWAYRNDGVDIEACSDADTSNGFNIGWLTADEWINYTVQIDSTAAYALTFRMATQVGGAKFHIELDDHQLTESILVSNTGGWQSWRDLNIFDVVLPEGEHVFKLYIEQGEFNLNYFECHSPTAPDSLPMNVVAAEAGSDGFTVTVDFTKPLQAPLPAAPGGFTLTANGESRTISDYSINETGYQIILTIDEQLFFEDALLLSYADGEITDSYGQPLQAFTDLNVTKAQPDRLQIPGRIQAEDYTFNQGFQFETTTDDGGGQNLGWSDPGDFIEYLVTINTAGTYNIDYRSASQNNGGRIKVDLIDSSGTQFVHSITLPVTGGWQSWTTTSKAAELPAGRYTLRMTCLTGGYNLNWFEFSSVTGIEEDLVVLPDRYALFQNYPNPFNPLTTFRFLLKDSGPVTLKIFNVLGQKVATLINRRMPAGDHQVVWKADDFSSGLYFYQLKAGEFTSTKRLLLQK